MGQESFDVIRFDLWPLFQGQMRIAKIKNAYNSLTPVARGLRCHTNPGFQIRVGHRSLTEFCNKTPNFK